MKKLAVLAILMFLWVGSAWAIYPNTNIRLFCWDIPSTGSFEFQLEITPTEHISYDWTYRDGGGVDISLKYGLLAHEAIDMPMWKFEAMGGYGYASRESKRIHDFGPIKEIPSLNVFWLHQHDKPWLFVNALWFGKDFFEGRDEAINALRENKSYTKIMISWPDLNYTRWINLEGGSDTEVTKGFCEERYY